MLFFIFFGGGVSPCLHVRSIWLLGLKAEELSCKCTSFFSNKQNMQGEVSSLAQEWEDTGWSLSHRLNTQQVGDTHSRVAALISGPALTSCLFYHLATLYTSSPPPAPQDRWWCLTRWTISFTTEVLSKNFLIGWWNSLSLILMPLYDLHKEMRASLRGVSVSKVVLRTSRVLRKFRQKKSHLLHTRTAYAFPDSFVATNWLTGYDSHKRKQDQLNKK